MHCDRSARGLLSATRKMHGRDLIRSPLIIVPLPFLTVALVLAPTLQAEAPGFIMWDTSELEERNSALGTRIGPDDSARETLADYVTPSGSHRFRFIRRDGDGRPELQDNIDEIV